MQLCSAIELSLTWILILLSKVWEFFPFYTSKEGTFSSVLLFKSLFSTTYAAVLYLLLLCHRKSHTSSKSKPTLNWPFLWSRETGQHFYTVMLSLILTFITFPVNIIVSYNYVLGISLVWCLFSSVLAESSWYQWQSLRWLGSEDPSPFKGQWAKV